MCSLDFLKLDSESHLHISRFSGITMGLQFIEREHVTKSKTISEVYFLNPKQAVISFLI